MKLLLTCCALFCAVFPVFSQQNWAPVGATWHYRQGAGFGEPIGQGFYRNTAVADTLVNGRLCTKIDQMKRVWTGENVPLGPVYTYMEHDSVYYYSPLKSDFVLTYDFSAQEGDTLTFPAPYWWNGATFETDSFFHVRVDSIRYRDAGGTSLRFFYVSNTDDQYYWWFYAGWYAERIGGRMFNSPFPAITIPEIDGFLRCYEDAQTFLHYSIEDCEYPFSTGLNTLPQTTDIQLFPNPVSDMLRVRCPAPGRYTVFYADGRTALSGRLEEEETYVKTGTLPVGCYVLQIESAVRIFSQRIVKQ